jgi:signal transduction histidine kinase
MSNGTQLSNKARKELVLVVEDNAEMNQFVTESLSAEYEVITAFDGQEGLQKALTFRPSIIVTDIMMPRVSGTEMIAELRRHNELNDTPILLLSAKADEELKIKLLSESAQDFILKPFSERDLQVRVANLVSARRSKGVVDQANVELSRRSQQLSSLFEQTPSFMAVLRGPDHVFELANKAYLTLIGHRNVLGKPLAEALPEIRPQGFIELLDQVISSGKAFNGYSVPLMIQRTPGASLEQVFLDFIYQPLLDINNKVSGVFVEGHDVTEAVISKKKLMENEERLEIQVQERTIELKELNQNLKISNDDLQQFAHVASHDLKEPIRKIKTFGLRLRDEYESVLPEHALGFLDKILSATDRVYSMIDGVLSYSTVTSQDQPTVSVDLNEILKNIQTDLEVLINERKATLTVTELPTIQGAPVLIYQLFYNLVNNSLKFSKKDVPPVIDISSTITTFERNEFARVVISDNGIGFSPENSDRIFSTFMRLNSKDKYEGTGLGLALCKKIVQRHGGAISAKGRKNQGAEFTVLLPIG